ncbi:MAG: hypothetical protein ACRCUT_07375 [Spirochaetota bacterium]
MKKTAAACFSVVAVFLSIPSYADTPAAAPENSADSGFFDLGEKGVQTSRVMIFGGAGKTLYGYTDVRYADPDDQGDYISSRYEYGGAELEIAGIDPLSSSLSELRLGGNLVVMNKGKYDGRTLYAVPLHSISEQTLPSDPTDKTGHFRAIPGFFAGLDLKWWEFDCGITVVTDAIYEKSREKLDPSSSPSNPVYTEVDGRGWIFNDVFMYLNFSMRLGPENMPHFLFYFMRHDYDPVYGRLQSKLVLPISRFFTMNVGSYLYPAQALYCEPVFEIYRVSIALKGGVIVNYSDDDIIRASIKDSIFAAASASYSW